MPVPYLSGATCAATQPLSILPTADGKIYAVNGVHRGVHYGGTTVYPIGITQAQGVTATTSASPLYYYVAGVEVISGGQNYYSAPSVSLTGVSGVKAHLGGSEVSRVTITTSATTHLAPPAVSFSGGQASGAAATPVLEATVTGVHIVYGGGYYSEPPAVTFYAASGVTESRAAHGFGVLNVATGATSGFLSGVVVTDVGEYQYTGSLASRARPVAATVTPPLAGSTPVLHVNTNAAIDSVTVSSGGTNYMTPPRLRFITRGLNRRGAGADADVLVSGGAVTSVSLKRFGSGYDGTVQVQFQNEAAKASPVMAPRLAGKYLCGVRYKDAAGQCGNLCDLFEVNCGDGASSITWNLTALNYTDATPNRVVSAELWRTSSDQAITLYRVATVASGTTSYVDSLTDAMLTDTARTGYEDLPILTADGYPSAFRFGIPPATMSSLCMFDDRVWYGVDESGAEPNAIYFSEQGEPESVPDTNQIVIQSTGRESDRITGMFPLEGALYVCQQRSITRVTVAGNPLESASAIPVAQRGLLNDRCWAMHEGVVYIADTVGLYSFDGSAVKTLSDPVQDFWTTDRLAFGSSKWFFLHINPEDRVVRMYYIHAGSTATRPTRALCYSMITQAWWEEHYANEIHSVATAYKSARPQYFAGSSAGIYRLESGGTDAGTPIDYEVKTGNYPLNTDPKRGIRVVYTPTSLPSTLKAAFYNSGAQLAQEFAIDSDTGTGFTTTRGSTQASLEMHVNRNASGFAQLSGAGRLDDRSASATRHIAVGLAGRRGDDGANGLARPIIHSMQVEGAG